MRLKKSSRSRRTRRRSRGRRRSLRAGGGGNSKAAANAAVAGAGLFGALATYTGRGSVKDIAGAAAAGGLLGYGGTSLINDLKRGTRTLAANAMGFETDTPSSADYVPLATAAAAGGLAYKYLPHKDGPGEMSKGTEGALAGVLGYGAGAGLRDLYKDIDGKSRRHRRGRR